MKTYIRPFAELGMKDVPQVGGKNASLGEMMKHLSSAQVNIPNGFAITASAYFDFLSSNSLCPIIQYHLNRLDTRTLDNLNDVSESCRKIINEASLHEPLKIEIKKFYDELVEKYGPLISLAVRSSATAEDSTQASFAGQHDTFLNVSGIENLFTAVKNCYASLFNDRAIKYRIDGGFAHMQIGQAVGVQLMVRSDKASAGVAFTIEPETGNNNLIYITGAWGLGESVVKGAVNADEFYLMKHTIDGGKNALIYSHLGEKQEMLIYGSKQGDKTLWQETPTPLRDQFVLNREELNLLAKWCYAIENHYKMPMDIEWAKDGITGQLYIVQARPETIHTKGKEISWKEYIFKPQTDSLLSGKAVGRAIVSGRVCIVNSLSDASKVKEGDIIVADITNPDWNALLRKTICIVTNKGGRTSHASIVARELGISAVVGTLDATKKLKDDQFITVSCASGDTGYVYDGKLEWTEKEIPANHLEHTRTKPMFILADPQKALLSASFPNEGVGLLRMEFIISNSVQIHPMALVKFHDLPRGPIRDQIEAITRHYVDKKQFFIERLSDSIGLVAAAFFPKDVIVRMSDFKTNEYAKLLGGEMFEPHEENPMLGFRGASRYYNNRYREGFKLECEAIKRVREEMGLENVKVMIPFCRTIEEAKQVLLTMKEFGLERGQHDLEIYVMAEIPSNILLAKQFAELFDGFSIGSNDLTQLTLGLDRDSSIVSDLFDENNEAIKLQIKHLITTAHEKNVRVGLCGQAPSDYPEFAQFLVSCGIDSISFNADSLICGIENIMVAEKKQQEELSDLIQMN
jgi:pyruvate, water dikinase